MSRDCSSWTTRPSATSASTAYAPPTIRSYLAFLGDVDGEPDAFLATTGEHVRAPGLRAIFSCCEGFTADDGSRRVDEARTARQPRELRQLARADGAQVREEAALHDALQRTSSVPHRRSDEPAARAGSRQSCATRSCATSRPAA